MKYQSVSTPAFVPKDPQNVRPDIDGPHGPPAWETAEDIAALYKLLDSVGCKLQVNLSDIKRDKKDQARNQLPETKPYAQVQSEPMQSGKKNKNQGKKGFSYLDGQQAPAQTSNTPWGAKLDQNVAGAQTNAEDFTKQFMKEMYSGSQFAVVSTDPEAAVAGTTEERLAQQIFQQQVLMS